MESEEKVKSLLLIPVLFFVGCATSPYAVRKPYLYEVTKDDQRAYLFGTMHAGILADDLPESFWTYFNESSVFVSEAGTDDQKIFEQQLMQRTHHRPDEPALRSVFTSDELVQLTNYLKPTLDKSNLEISNLSFFGVYGLLRIQLKSTIYRVDVRRQDYVRFTGKFKLDGELLNRAQKLKINTQTLDDVSSNDLVSCLVPSYQELASRTRALLKDPHLQNSFEQINAMARNYREGQNIILQNLDDGPECLLAGRNRLWLPKMLIIMKQNEKPFFAIGVGHLLAKKDSLIDLLRAQGYTVRRMTETFLRAEKE